ncbi:MAG: hypothetical protein FJW63_03065 [Actinobacteria bacterium]|nr:hypothetical protein [Actinomycetota bacterium]MBM3701968.1 hypothetical protein [Actinomycetota bacterium]MBU2563325.1 hypothetical protein [Actinomycetota bacterium]
MKTVKVPENEYLKMRKTIKILSDSKLLKRINELIEILFQEKYNIVLTDYTDDLTEFSVNNIKEWDVKKSKWDNV